MELLFEVIEGLFGPAEPNTGGTYTFRVVVALLLPFEWPEAEAVTVVVSVPEVYPAFPLTVSVIDELVAPAASVTELEPIVDALKLVELLSDNESEYATLEHPLPESLFFIVIK
jgi:hypothetical protein